MPLVKSSQGRQVTIPKKVWDALKLNAVEFFEITEEGGRIVLSPTQNVDEDQKAYLSDEVQAEVRAGLKEIAEGKTKRFDTVDDLIADLRS